MAVGSQRQAIQQPTDRRSRQRQAETHHRGRLPHQPLGTPAADRLQQLVALANNSPRTAQLRSLQELANNSPRATELRQLQALATSHKQSKEPEPAGTPQIAKPTPNRTGLPDALKSGIEALSGVSMDQVRVHYNSAQPARLNALAYAQGTDIHLAPGQERHLPHEAWHVVQQAQGRVRPMLQMKDGVSVNDDEGLEHEADTMGARVLTQAIQRSENATSTQRAGLDQIGKSRVAQMKDPRSNNPHNPQTGVTSHHIIPHELLETILGKFEKDKKDEITRIFLPDFTSLTLANFVAQGSVSVKYDGRIRKKVTEIPEEIATKPFSKFTVQEKEKTKFGVEDAGEITMDQLTNLYGQLKAGQEIKNDAGETVSGLRDISEAFFEWQSGNLFYGPERIEPGKKDGFDFDAKLIYNESFTNKMEAIYRELREQETKDDEPSKNRMMQALKRMADLTLGVGIPGYDPKIWLPIDTDAKKTVHDIMLPERHETSKKDSSVHHKILTSAINRYCDDKTMVHKFLLSIKSGHGEISDEPIFSAKKRSLCLKDAPDIKVQHPVGIMMKDIQDSMITLLNRLFGLQQK